MARKVLVADDSPTHQRKANGILTGEGLEVVTVSNGVAAIKKLPTVRPLLVLADVSMPGKDGYEVCEFVKNSPDLSHVPVLLIFSDLEPYDEQRAARVRADGTIKKPFVQEELVAAVTHLIARAEGAPPQPGLPPPITAPPPPVMVTEPADMEPEISTKVEAPELAALPEDVAFAAPALEAVPVAAPEAAVAEPAAGRAAVEPVVEEQVTPLPEVAATGEPVAPAEEAAPEIAPVPEEAPPPVEPVLVEEVPAVAPPPPPSAEATLAFRAPAEIAEPILSEELPAAAPVTEPAPEAAPRLPEPVPEAAAAEVPPVAATTLESFSLIEAGTGQVRFAAPEAEAPVEAEAVGEIPAPVPEAAPAPAPVAAVDANLIHAIVHRVVLKMAPPALPPQVIEDMARQLAEEIIAEFGSGASHTQ